MTAHHHVEHAADVHHHRQADDHAGCSCPEGYRPAFGAQADFPLTLPYNPKRKHVRNGMLSPVEFERQQKI